MSPARDRSVSSRDPFADAPRIDLPRELGRAIAQGHPWIYRDHVPRNFQAPPGTWVHANADGVSRIALWDPDSPIALRIYSRTQIPDEPWFLARLEEAHELRASLGVPRVASAYRWVAGEGDGIPGVLVDRYAAFAVVVLDTEALGAYLPWIVSGLKRIAPLHGIFRRLRGDDGGRLEMLSGRLPPDGLVVEEHGARFYADLARGQKTGLFLDQRENRRYVGEMAAGRTVLNLFGYTGGFSVHALRGGAVHVTTVDVASDAVRRAEDNFRLNGLDPALHEFVVGDVFEYLARARESGRRFDVVISDPPSFARTRAHRERAIEAYARLHAAALAVTKLGGFYVASSCSTQVGVDAFHASLRGGAARARVRLTVCHDAGHAADHPILAGHPEGRYLKFVVGRVAAEP